MHCAADDPESSGRAWPAASQVAPRGPEYLGFTSPRYPNTSAEGWLPHTAKLAAADPSLG